MDKLTFAGIILAVQPRIRLIRSFDQSSHAYLGFVLRIRGTLAGQEREFTVGIGNAAHAKHQFRAGDAISGECLPVADPEKEPVDYYKTSKLKLTARPEQSPPSAPPPWLGIPPTLPTYRARGHRRLAARTYDTQCLTCIWACRMSVEMIIDHWNPSKKRYRTETFCYGPKSCPLYKPGPTRKVPGRRGMSWTEEDWVDEQATAHRGEHD
ncbi:MAG: hypothetical protein A3G34_10675 [Candidatus Lindowbacteria bacterium RIFCSPLOWO2_12_FULL_62_27]|nr:MAG: hypothetical protein A3G34_10675 [Candidatus Lindowbacteria bacterium RIFCSPLOWO2_12_FULL_62_27]